MTVLCSRRCWRSPEREAGGFQAGSNVHLPHIDIEGFCRPPGSDRGSGGLPSATSRRSGIARLRVDVDGPVGDVLDHEDAVLDERVLLHQLPNLVRVLRLPDRHRAEPSGPCATHDEEPAVDLSVDECRVLVPARLVLRQTARPGYSPTRRTTRGIRSGMTLRPSLDLARMRGVQNRAVWVFK